MKQIFTLLLIFSCTFLFGQNLTLNVTSLELQLNGYSDYGDVTLTNNTNEDIEIAARLEKTCTTQGDESTVQLCIGLACFIPTGVTTTYGDNLATDAILIIEAGASAEDALKFTALNSIFGTGWRVVYFDRNNPTSEAIIDVNVGECSSVLNTIDLSLDLQKAFPNPATSFISIPYQLTDTENAQLQIFNAQGILLSKRNINKNEKSVIVDLSTFNSGIYFYNIANGNKLSRTLTFVK